SFETSDSLLLLDPRWFLCESVDVAGMLREANHHRWVQHFLTMRRDPDGAKERVHLDPDGRVKRIQRYYYAKMGRQTSGIACSRFRRFRSRRRRWTKTFRCHVWPICGTSSRRAVFPVVMPASLTVRTSSMKKAAF